MEKGLGRRPRPSNEFSELSRATIEAEEVYAVRACVGRRKPRLRGGGAPPAAGEGAAEVSEGSESSRESSDCSCLVGQKRPVSDLW